MGAADNLGTGWGFPPQFFNNGKEVALVADVEDVKESLEILIGTVVQERPYHPDFGCDLKQFMFEEIDRSLVTEIQQMIKKSILNYEPRVEVGEITVGESDEAAHILVIKINYLIKATNTQDNLVFSLPLY